MNLLLSFSLSSPDKFYCSLEQLSSYCNLSIPNNFVNYWRSTFIAKKWYFDYLQLLLSRKKIKKSRKIWCCRYGILSGLLQLYCWVSVSKIWSTLFCHLFLQHSLNAPSRRNHFPKWLVPIIFYKKLNSHRWGKWKLFNWKESVRWILHFKKIFINV